MTEQLETLALDLLAGVHGGQQGPNTESEQVNVPVPGAPPVIDKKGSRTDWAYCADIVKSIGGAPSDIRSTCGLPPGATP